MAKHEAGHVVPRRVWTRSGQYVVTAGLMTLIIQSVDWSGLSQLLIGLRWELVVSSAILVAGCHLTNVYRWWSLLPPTTIGFGSLLTIYGAGLFSNNFLPTGIGGDGIRTALLSRRLPVAQSLLSVVLDRLIGCVALSALVVWGSWYGWPLGTEWGWGNESLRSPWLQGTLVVMCSGLSIGGWLVWQRLPQVRRWGTQFLRHWFGEEASSRWSRQHWFALFGSAYSLSVVSLVGLVLANWVAFAAFRLDISLGAAVWVVVLVSLALLLPIAVNGLGLMEATYVVLLAHYDVSASAALGVALLMRVLMLFFSLVGGFVSLGVR